ncbi:restriction endonuclease [Moorena bouillonii]|uniref:restriction endonuclease n=1 Tax=Moorena bouillonii TaxID=207920 RepID=UPI00118095DC|nr:restriction endonuclease [Moorena bouillonii]
MLTINILSTLNLGFSATLPKQPTLHRRPKAKNLQPSTFNLQPSTFNLQPTPFTITLP